jgi:acyl-CoA reductase-like NAD-dependent aldehyde dehydrogenase
MTSTDKTWHQRASELAIDGRAFIQGRRQDAQDGQTFECRSPIDGRLLGPVARGQAADIDAAVTSARRAFDDGRWALRPRARRCCCALPS